MTAKEYLKQAYFIDRRIKAKERQLEALRTHAVYVSPRIDGMPHGNGAGSSALESAAVRIMELEGELSGQIEKYADVRKHVTQVIHAVNNPEYEAVLEMRYLSFMDWKEIMSAMGYSRSYVYEIHGRALQLVHVPD